VGELRTSQKSDPEPLAVRHLTVGAGDTAQLARAPENNRNLVRDAADASLQKAAGLVEQIRSGDFAPRPGRSCFGCPLAEVCRSSTMGDPARLRQRAQMPLTVSESELAEARRKAQAENPEPRAGRP
jgi:hypothetical protein